MRPCVSVSGTRCTRCTPDSNFSFANAPRPRTSAMISLKPPMVPSLAEIRSEPLRLCVGHALHPVHAGFEFQLCKCAAATHFGDDFLEATHGAFAGGDHLDLPALQACKTLIHPEQVAGEQSGLVAAGAGADFQHHVALVHGVLRQ